MLFHTLALVLCFPQVSPSESAVVTPVFDLGHNAIRFDTSAELLLYLVPESMPGEPDLNGDGDRQDWVAHIADPRSGVSTNLGLAAELTIEVDGPRAAFLVVESAQAHTDLNGDGDSQDEVLHVYDTRTGAVTNVGLAATSFHLRKDVVALAVSEELQGALDFNGDGDAEDQVLQLVDLATFQVRSLSIATGTGTFELAAGYVAFLVPEFTQGHTDLNGDGDAIDAVLHTADVASGAIQNLGLASIFFQGFHFDPPVLVFRVDEDAQRADLNGDGDRLDDVLHYQLVPGGPVTNLRLPAIDFLHGRHQIAFRVPEADQGGRDLNGDGDAADLVLFAGSLVGQEFKNLRLAAEDYVFGGGTLLFRAREASQGTDLNGDGDLGDQVAHVYDLRRRITANLRLAALGIAATERRATIRVSEFFQGGLDLNGDGDGTDTLLHLFDIETGVTTNLGFAVPGGTGSEDPDLELAPDRLAFLREERGEGRDLNADGDALDAVVHVLDFSAHPPMNLRRASPRSGIPPALVLRSGVLLFCIDEVSQGGMDLNGDGDATDELLQVALVGAGH